MIVTKIFAKNKIPSAAICGITLTNIVHISVAFGDECFSSELPWEQKIQGWINYSTHVVDRHWSGFCVAAVRVSSAIRRKQNGC